MRIGIVGGSIAGCTAAHLLQKEGHEIKVFERSKRALVGRGGGIGTTPALLDEIRNNGLITEDFASFRISSMPFIGKLESAEPFGRKAWSMPMSFEVFQWNELWKKLRNNVPDKNYHSGTKIVHTETGMNGNPILFMQNGSKEEFDLVLFADGYNSIGRRILFPEKKLKYRGYVLWRGLLSEKNMRGMSPLKDEILRLSYRNQPGHTVFYFIPNPDGSTEQGKRIFNWAAYIAVSENDLIDIMTDKKGKQRSGTLPPGSITEKNERELKQFLAQNIPAHYAEIVNKTKNSYIQVIYTLDLDHYYKDRIGLIGDAGMVVQPFTGSGVFKGYHNVKELICYMDECNSMDETLQKWSSKQIENGRKLLVLGKQMEKAFIWNQLDFTSSTEEETAKWWKASVNFPENFNYERRG